MTTSNGPWRIAVVTGTRAEFGLLRPVMSAIEKCEDLELQVLVTGTHLLPEVGTVAEVASTFRVAAMVPMQSKGETGRSADVTALGRGIIGLGQALDRVQAEVVLVLGDRIEAFAAASAASIGGRLIAHIHGGDRAEGVADEAMRHAITKLAHIHFPATETSANRIIRMGEPESLIFNVGSPAIDDLESFKPLPDDDLVPLGINSAKPFAVVLHHPTGQADDEECQQMQMILEAVETTESLAGNLVVMSPNHDPGHEGIIRAIGSRSMPGHLERSQFIGLLRRASVLIGNSSAGLIEAAALGRGVVNIGSRQAGREQAGNVFDVASVETDGIRNAVEQAIQFKATGEHPYGQGTAGKKIAQILSDLRTDPPAIRKRNVY